MRFDEFLTHRNLPAVTVDRFDGYTVQVGLPEDWAPLNSTPGVKVWAWTADPNLAVFCANAVLTMHRIPAALDPAEVFVMLCQQQLHMLPGSVERGRELTAAADGPGVAGALAMDIASEHGTLDSRSHTRILSEHHQTLIAQLTITALPDSPLDRPAIWLTVTTGGAAPVNAPQPRQGRHEQ